MVFSTHVWVCHITLFTLWILQHRKADIHTWQMMELSRLRAISPTNRSRMSTSDHTLVDELGDTLPKIVMSFAKHGAPRRSNLPGRKSGFFLVWCYGMLNAVSKNNQYHHTIQPLCTSIFFLNPILLLKSHQNLHIFWVLGRALKLTNLRV